ncbi:hypothetical protein GA0070606_0382 [Micromonospora citrea]|uniref:Trypsin-co-occurring domain-containing protein n=1 Tax=Micromonospora citrea TaxID=47855 RepID=A0A1C6TSI2_9ACTN|nr:CU044_2847 family protein [Micromonospora citrea]SCL44638.1 hypothetical protein GA0070606_0382 [Micromonospora citrea]
MSRLVKVQLPSGQQIWAQVTDGPADVGAADALRSLSAEDLRDTIEGVAQSVAAAAESVLPDQVSLEFGLELSLKTGKLTSVLAEAAGKASLKLTLTWDTTGGRAPGTRSAPGDDETSGGTAGPPEQSS